MTDSRLPFGDHLAELVHSRQSQLVLGVDPNPHNLWPAALEAAEGDRGGSDLTPARRAARAVLNHCQLLIEAVGDSCVGVKFQVACFEQLGAPGWEALTRACAAARDAGLFVLADAKRGDVPVTAEVYAHGLFGEVSTPFGAVPGLQADAATVNPLLGRDSIEPFVNLARGNNAGVFLLVRTSNPGAVDIQDEKLAAGVPLWERTAQIVNEISVQRVGRSGLGDIGAVVGATVPAHLSRARELMPNVIFLLPGVGAQGGSVAGLAPVFSSSRAGGLVAASRSIAFAWRHSGGDPAGAARAEAERLRAAAWALG